MYQMQAEKYSVEREQHSQLHREERAKLIEQQLTPGHASSPVTSHPVTMTTPNFAAFDPTSEL